jgi:hypothetical protein
MRPLTELREQSSEWREFIDYWVDVVHDGDFELATKHWRRCVDEVRTNDGIRQQCGQQRITQAEIKVQNDLRVAAADGLGCPFCRRDMRVQAPGWHRYARQGPAHWSDTRLLKRRNRSWAYFFAPQRPPRVLLFNAGVLGRMFDFFDENEIPMPMSTAEEIVAWLRGNGDDGSQQLPSFAPVPAPPMA